MDKRRVVVTGLGVVSSIGNNAAEVLASLKAGKSGITFNEDMAEHGFRSQIAGAVDLNVADHVDKRTLRFMGPGAAYAHIAMAQAIADAGLEKEQIDGILTHPGTTSPEGATHYLRFAQAVGLTRRQLDGVGIEIPLQRADLLAYEATYGLRDHRLLFGQVDVHGALALLLASS